MLHLPKKCNDNRISEENAPDKGESVSITLNDGPEMTLGSAEANEAIAKLKA